MCFFIIFTWCVDVVSKADIKKQFRDIIFVEDDDGNLVKYIRAKPSKQRKPTPQPAAPRAKPSKKPKPNAKPSSLPAAPRAKPSKQPKCNAKPKPSPSAAAKLSPAPLKSYQIEAEKMTKLSVVLVPLTEADIAKECEKIKREYTINQIKDKLKPLPMLKMCDFSLYAFSIEPRLQFVNGNIKFESVSDGALQLMNQYFTKDIYSKDINTIDISKTQSGGFAICLPDFGKIVISMPVWKNIYVNPLQDPMFVLGDSWSFDLQSDGKLAISLPEVHGKRETFLFCEPVWRNWIGSDDNIHAQSLVESLMDIDTSDIAKLFGDIEIFSMDWLSESLINMSIGSSKAIDSMCEDTQPNINEQSIISTSGYDASIEVGPNQINHCEYDMI